MSAAAGSDVVGEERPATFREVFAVREFRPLFVTFLLSTVGDELARVALTVLVYQRTASPLLSALTFAISFLPWLIGGPLLSPLADRLPRERVLVVTDLVRAVLVACLAIPGTPLPLLLVLLFVLSCGAPPFESARSALVADILQGGRYAVATSLTNLGSHLAQVVGFVAAAGFVALAGASTVLLVDAATFLLSALWLHRALERRSAPAPEGQRGSMWADSREGLRLILRSPRLRSIIAVTWVASLFANAADGVAAPLADRLGERPWVIGVLLAANPCGLVLGGLLLARLVPAVQRERWVPGLVVLSLAPVLLAGLLVAYGPVGHVTSALVVALLFVTGLGTAWSLALNVAFVQSVPSAYRGRAFGVAASGLMAVQGLGVLGAGVVAEWLPPEGVLVVIGVVGVLAVLPALAAYRRTQGHVAADPAAAGPSVA